MEDLWWSLETYGGSFVTARSEVMKWDLHALGSAVISFDCCKPSTVLGCFSRTMTDLGFFGTEMATNETSQLR